ncbi:MAG: methyl coenzyme M reductase system, component A2 [Candidatus Methanolliviera sp. GoM_oil]|nr:MAG: methyl coenzyme M reductase system, component A2 [Candidatus Methanolliviera sp. GoM_oil]
MVEDFLTVKNVTKEFKEIPVVRDVSFTIKEEDAFGLLGRCGAGKSVLMQSIRGADGYEPTYGNIIFNVAYCPNCNRVEYPSMDGEKCPVCSTKMSSTEIDYWEGLKEQDMIALSLFNRIALMPQRGFALYTFLSVTENIMKSLESIGYPKEKMKERTSELISGLRLDQCAASIGRDLSGGEKQRVICAASLAKRPLLFLADEPTGTLDFVTAEVVHGTVKRYIEREHISLVLTSHWPDAVRTLTDKATLMQDGKIIEIGRSDEMCHTFEEGVEEVHFERYKGNKPLLICKDLKKHYRGLFGGEQSSIKAVDGVSCEIKENEIFGIVGLSGAGKTSVAHMSVGIEPITSGSITIRMGDEWVDMNVPGPAGRGRVTPHMDILHQEYSLHEGEIILENLISRIRADIPDEEKTRLAYGALQIVNFTNDEIDYLLYKYPGELGEGERHRICIACALIRTPIFVILDEPTGTADPITRIEIAKSIRKARSSMKQTYLIISHDIDFTKAVCDRVAYMRKGKIVDIGDPDEMVELMIKTERKNLKENS